MIIRSPLKYQGSKYKLASWIKEIANYQPEQRWVEPFFGSGSVGFNISPTSAIMSDINPHIITLFKDIQTNQPFMDTFLNDIVQLGETLNEQGEEFYYDMRKAFNILPTSLLLIFLNHTSYNGVMRFNQNGEYNVPYGKNPRKLSIDFCVELENRLIEFRNRMTENWDFNTEPFDKIIPKTDENDIIYCDPPYIERISTYYGTWGDKEERQLHDMLSNIPGKFILSTWIEAKGERNPYFDELWSGFNVHTKEHNYVVGQTKENRYPVIEALVTNYDTPEI